LLRCGWVLFGLVLC